MISKFLTFENSRKNIFWIPFWIASVSLFAFTCAIIFQWFGEAEGYGSMFCESGYSGLIKQPVNTFSNIGFVIVGLSIAWSQAKGRYAQNNNLFTRGSFFPIFFGSLAVLVGPGSMALHATTTRVGGILDLLSMYLVASFIFSYAVTRLFKWKSKGFTLMFLLAMSIQLFAHNLNYEIPTVGLLRIVVFGLFIILTGIIEIFSFFFRKVEIDIKYGIASALTMITAGVIWGLSKTNAPWCDSSSLIQGHGFWHLLVALAIYFLYKFYVSENLISKRLEV